MKQQRRHTFGFISSLMAVVVCLSPLIAIADNTPTSPLFGNTQNDGTNQPLVLLPLQKENSPANLAFDLGGSESRKLALQLTKPITLSINNNFQKSSSGVGSVFLDSSLSMQLSDNLDITSSLGAGRTQSSFQPLGSIHCQNGVLDQGSFRASDCYFINQANVLKQDQVALGLRYGKGKFNTAVSMFRREANIGQQGVVNYTTPMNGAALGAGMLTPDSGNSLLPAMSLGQPLNYLSGETSGLDIEFQVGFAMDSAGDIRLGLQLTHFMDASYEASSTLAPGLQNWTISNPFDSAKMNLDWSKGNFSGGLQGYYREPVQFLNREELDSSTTFDVHFTWRAPWNANLSVGTTNVLGGNSDKGKTETGLNDPFEAVYGRIPYVRYQQDL
ncbi:MAG: hypothetical protein QNK19_05840 [Xanthomonadales bacterium]|nr:hypothetical protein [Xanthomonadales bacterium]